MFVVLVYDIRVKRVAKIMKICRKYLVHVQKSVFEGRITESNLKKLKKELELHMDAKEDQIIIYRFESTKYASKEQIGIILSNESVI